VRQPGRTSAGAPLPLARNPTVLGDSVSARLARSRRNGLSDVDHSQDEESSPDYGAHLIFLEGGTVCDWLRDSVCHLLAPALQPRLSKFSHRSHVHLLVFAGSVLPGYPAAPACTRTAPRGSRSYLRRGAALHARLGRSFRLARHAALLRTARTVYEDQIVHPSTPLHPRVVERSGAPAGVRGRGARGDAAEVSEELAAWPSWPSALPRRFHSIIRDMSVR
jgi:hypothetical protein